MTGGEILSHILAALGTSGPVAGFLISERSKRKTAEAQTTQHIAGAIEEATKGIRVNLEQTAEIARAAMKKADECEKGRDVEKKDCAQRIEMLESCQKSDQILLEKLGDRCELAEKRGTKMQEELLGLHELIRAMKPDTTHSGVVE